MNTLEAGDSWGLGEGQEAGLLQAQFFFHFFFFFLFFFFSLIAVAKTS